MMLFALSIAPGIAISLYFFYRDQYNREPGRHLMFSFLLGVLSAVPAILLQMILLPIQEMLMPENILSIAVKAFFIVAFTEEWCKYLMVRYYAYRQPEFDEPFDGIVYAVMVGMGFATIENIGYVMQHGLATAIARMFLSVPAHAGFAILMGYYMGKAKFKPQQRFLYMMRGLFLAVFFHGAFDFFLFLRDNSLIQKNISDIFLITGAIVIFISALYFSRKAIREHVNISRMMHGKSDFDQHS
jgi:RsiW-degrading membrane proteinase PrsW (M82 family)